MSRTFALLLCFALFGAVVSQGMRGRGASRRGGGAAISPLLAGLSDNPVMSYMVLSRMMGGRGGKGGAKGMMSMLPMMMLMGGDMAMEDMMMMMMMTNMMGQKGGAAMKQG